MKQHSVKADFVRPGTLVMCFKHRQHVRADDTPGAAFRIRHDSGGDLCDSERFAIRVTRLAGREEACQAIREE